MKRPIAVALIAALAACAQPFRGRVADNLAEAGLSPRMADCMAGIWVDRLNVLQLRKISDLSADLRREGRGLTVLRFVERVREVDDSEIFEVVSTSAARCAVSG
jgi:hypothetical protein